MWGTAAVKERQGRGEDFVCWQLLDRDIIMML